MDLFPSKTEIIVRTTISITMTISVGTDCIRPELESMKNKLNNDLVFEINDLIMKQNEKGSDHCYFKESQQRECDDASGICSDCFN